MTLRDGFEVVYQWALRERDGIVVACVALPVVGAVLARIGKAGRTDADGRFIASAVVALGILVFVIEVIGAVIATSVFGRNVLDADLLLLLAPVVCLAGCLISIRWVFPLNQLASVRTALDVGMFVGACIGVIWLFSKFRGWGIVFLGGVGQIVTIAVFLWALLRRLYRRAFGAGSSPV